MTNYEKLMNEMTVEKLAELIECSTAVNICSFCIFQRDYSCHWNCHEGIEEMQKVRNMGKRSLEEIENKMNEYGLRFRPGVEDERV